MIKDGFSDLLKTKRKNICKINGKFHLYNMKIFARDKEKKILNEIVQSDRPEFLAVYGRRRVGKTYLIKNFIEDKAM